MASRSTHLPGTSAVPRSPPNHPRSDSPTCSSGRCSPPLGNRRTRATLRWWPCSACWVWPIFEATGADIADLGEERGHRVLRVCGKGTQAVLVPLPPAVGRAIDRAIGSRTCGPVLLNSRGARMDRHAATGRLHQLAEAADIRVTSAHPHMLRHTVATMLDAGLDLREVQIAARHADPRTTLRYDRARENLDRHPNYILAAYMASASRRVPRLGARRPDVPGGGEDPARAVPSAADSGCRDSSRTPRALPCPEGR